MPTIPHFDPPANLTDFDTITDQRAAWDEFIGLSFQANIEDVQAEIGAGKSQFYNPKVTSTDPPVATDVIRWKGFPLVLAAKHPGNEKAALAEADQLTKSSLTGPHFHFSFARRTSTWSGLAPGTSKGRSPGLSSPARDRSIGRRWHTATRRSTLARVLRVDLAALNIPMRRVTSRNCKTFISSSSARPCSSLTYSTSTAVTSAGTSGTPRRGCSPQQPF